MGTNKGRTVIVPISQVRKPELRDKKELSQGHLAGTLQQTPESKLTRAQALSHYNIMPQSARLFRWKKEQKNTAASLSLRPFTCKMD